MVTAIIGKKIGMTQLFGDGGVVHPATVIKAGPCVVVQAKTTARDGYEAVQLGLVEDTKPRVTKAVAGTYKKAKVSPTRIRREVAMDSSDESPKPGDQVLVSIFESGDRVDVIGTSRGKGFQGVMKRHGFSGGRATHGSMFHRAPGSIGASSYPSRVIKGMKGPGRMGGQRVTVRSLQVLQVDTENNLLIVNGSIPGAPGTYITVRKAVVLKPVRVSQVEEPKKK
jgi:large subunit ribosomal protein L3|tara:strand:+ start:188 stop:862 length:675 start_codon:yes stop_codon:yes gene_type:complete